MQKLKLTLIALLLAVTGSFAQIIINVTTTNTTGAGSLQAAITQAYQAPADNKIIRFAMPVAASYILTPGTLNLAASPNVTSLTIDATTQTGYAGQPIVILQGGGTGNCFNVGGSNITIKGFIIQNYKNGYYQYSGNINSIESCWFGLNATGTVAAAGPITDYGILIQGNPVNNSVAIGSQSDFTAATRNIVSGCGISGIKFDAAGTGSYIGNTYIGTDVSGTLPVGNGTSAAAGTEFRHGVTVSNTPSLTIKNNLISANKSGGIDISGNSANSIITGNKIGTSANGLAPLGNRTFGLRIKGSGTHTIGGLTLAEGNIISANGSSDYEHEQNTTDPAKFDWYNSCGIYLFNSGNNTLANNYIGVDAGGNIYTPSPYDMGNFYVGIKIDGNSPNNKVGLAAAGNIVGQNGFRSSIAAAQKGYINLDGHGMIIKDKLTSGTLVYANRVGIGADGNSKVGNKQDGISVQGSTGTIIGGALPTQRNVIGDNTWGIFIASNYYDAQATNCKISGNYIGTNAAGTAPVGNGMRPDNTWGGGIGVIHFTQGTTIGGSGTGDGNVISGNRTGISLLGNSPTYNPISVDGGKGSVTSKIYGNLIGLNALGTDTISNRENGIYISEKANNNDIGGLTAGQGNKISGNGQNGIYSDDATNNRIAGNSIYANTLIGIGFDKTTNSTIEKNLIYSNPANGIVLKGASNANKFFGNTIGDLVLAAKGNTGDGINITASSNNVIGGVNAGEGNTIANNTGNGISITGATSVNNSIHRNIISCNGLRGIELNATANGNYAKPTFSGTETALVVTGPANSYIELYSLDGCNNCTDLTSKKLQGKTLVASGNSPLSFPGTVGVTYTATASQFNLSTAHNTSEFSDCYSLCPPPNVGLSVTGSTVCQGTDGTIGIKSTQNVSYQPYIGTTAVGPKVNGPGDISLTVLSANLVTGDNIITVKANAVGCNPSDLSNKATIKVNPPVKIDLTVAGSTVCPGTNGTVSISASEAISYQAYIGTTAVGAPVSGPGNITLTIPSASLVQGSNTISFKGTPTGLGCLPTDLTNKATVIQNPPVKIDLTVAGSTVCPGTNGTVSISASEAISYQAYIGTAAVGAPVSGPGNITLTIPSASLVQGSNTISFKGTPTGLGCLPTDLTNKATVIQNPPVKIDLTVSGNTVCPGTNGTVNITASQAISYQAYIGTTAVGTAKSGPGDISISIPAASLVEGNNVISFTGTPTGTGCLPSDLTNKATVVVNPPVKIDLAVSGSTVCQGTNGTVTITASQSISYQAYIGNTAVGTPVSGPGNIILTIPAASLVPGDNIISFKGTATGAGCNPVDLTNKATVIMNTPPKITSDVTSNTPICFGAQGIVNVVTAEKGKSYQIFDQTNTAVSNLTLANVDGLLSINLFSLAVNSYTLTVKASVAGCAGTVNLAKTIPFVVNKGLDGALTLDYVPVICLGTAASITIKNSESLVEYQAFNQKDDSPASNSVIGDGKDKVVPLFPLPAGTNIIYFKARIGGCGEVKLGNTATIKVNTDIKKELTATATSPICLGDVAVVTITGAENDKSYEIFENKVSVSSKVPGNNGTIKIDVPGLGIGDHKFTVNVTVPGCKNDTLLQNPFTKVNSAPDSTLKVGTNGPVCAGNQAVFYILKPQPGKKYQIFNSSTPVSQVVSGSGDTLKINLDNLIPGTYTLTAKATADGCNSSTSLADKGTIVVNSVPKTDLIATVNGPVCLGNPAIVTVQLAEKGKSYQVYYNGTAVSASLPGNDTGLDITVNTQTIPAGTHALSVGIKVPGCTSDTLIRKPLLTINTSPDSTLLVSAVTSPICVGTDGAVRISGIQQKVSYQAYLGTDSVSLNLSGTGPDLILPIPASKLLPGLNNISVKASIKGCKVNNLADTAGIKVNPNPGIDLKISIAPDVVCEGGESILTIATSESGVSYQAVSGGKPVSSAVLSTGGEVKLVVTNLPQGLNVVSVKASVAGCISRDLDSTVNVTVNKGAKINYGLTGSTVCKPAGGTVTISGSETGVSYQAYNKTTNTSVSPVIAGTGNAITLSLDPSQNEVDTIIVKAIVTGCGLVRLDSQTVVITNDENVSRLLSTRGSTICINDANGTATILKARPGVVYEAKIGALSLPAQTGNGNDLLFTIQSSALTEGNNIVSFTATAKGCGPVALDSSALIVVNNNTDKGLATRGSDICVNDLSGTATILSAKKGISYQATIGNTQLPDILTGTGADLVFNIPVSNIAMGSNTVTFRATVPGCTPADLSNAAIINRNDNTTSQDLPTRGSTVCMSDNNATARVLGAKRGITYQAFKGTIAVSAPEVGNDADLSLNLPNSGLSPGENIITFKAIVSGCDTVTLDSTAIVTLLGERYVIAGPDIRCHGAEGIYSISAVPGIVNYVWTVPNGAVIDTGQGTNRVKVTFGTESGFVSVAPSGSIGTCNGIKSELFVDVERPFTDTINIIGNDTVCFNDKKRLFVDSNFVFGVDSIIWTWSSGMQITDTLYKKGIFKNLGFTYPKVGVQMVTATPHLTCSDTYGVPDTLMVVVLAYPVAEAGNYPLIENDFNTPLNLNGFGSSLEGDTPNDSLRYKWSASKKNVLIYNSTTLNNAAFIPGETDNKVYLTITNHNRCPVSDSAMITVSANIEIPNIFTPNGDDVHDKWEIKNLHRLYPNCTVDVFNKWGNFIFRSEGYAEAWDGTRNGEDMPVATYYYIVDFKNGTKPRTGSLTIIR